MACQWTLAAAQHKMSALKFGLGIVPRVVYMVEFDDFMSQLEQSSPSDPSSKPVQQVRHNIIPGPRIPRPMNHLSGQRPDKPNPITSSCKTARRRKYITPILGPRETKESCN